MATIERYDGSSWVELPHQSWKVENPTSPVGVAPKAQIDATARETVGAAERVRIITEGETIFEGRAIGSGKIAQNGRRRIQVDGHGHDLFTESVSVDVTNPTDRDVLEAALSAADRGANFTLAYNGTPIDVGDYQVDSRKVRTIYRDMTDRAGTIWWVDSVEQTIHIETLGGRGQFAAVETGNDAVGVTEWSDGDVRTVINDVTVNGTGDVRVTGTATDSNSIEEYGRRSEEYNYEYITGESEANAMASELLIPDPQAEAKLIVGKTVGDVHRNLANVTLEVTDDPKDVTAETVVVEKQVVREGRAELTCGAGSGRDLRDANRKAQSNRDTTEPGSVMDADRIADESIVESKLEDLAVSVDKIRDRAISEGKLQSDSVGTDKIQSFAITNPLISSEAVGTGELVDLSITETKIDDDSISTPKLQAEAVAAENIIADTIGAREIAAESITADELSANSITSDKVDTGAIDAIHIATDAIESDKILAGSVGADEIAASSITADLIDVLDLQTEDLSISDTDMDGSIVFSAEPGGSLQADTFRMYNTGSGTRFFLGNPDNPVNVQAGTVVPAGDDTGNIGNASNAYNSVYSYRFVDASDGTTINDGGDPLVDLSSMDTPPEFATAEGGGVIMGELSRWLFDVCVAQQRRVESLESRLSELEAHVKGDTAESE